MTTQQFHQTRKGVVIASSAALCGGLLSVAGFPAPDAYILERTVGYQPANRPHRVEWKASEPIQTNLTVYSTSVPPFNRALMQRVADHFQVRGEIRQFTDPDAFAFGYVIEERDPTNRTTVRDVAYIATTGAFRYGTADRGDRWDIQSHRPLVHGVPEKVEALETAISLLPLLGISTNDLHHRRDGSLFSSFGEEGVTYNNRVTKERKRIVIQRSVNFYQKIPGGEVINSVGDGGQVRFTFVSEGKVTSIGWFFRRLDPVGHARPKSRRELMEDVKVGRCWTYYQNVPRSLTINNCEIVYPQGNSGTHQMFVWPFYMLTGVGDEGRPVTLFVAAKWSK